MLTRKKPLIIEIDSDKPYLASVIKQILYKGFCSKEDYIQLNTALQLIGPLNEPNTTEERM